MDQLSEATLNTTPTRARPLLGTTILLVEDSRYSAESFRLLCLRSGARIRRADTLDHARRHLRVYRPNVALIDMTLPDGSGAELIAELAASDQRIDAIVAVSGDDAAEPTAMAAGADAFLAKPISRIADFQGFLLPLLPAERRPKGPRAVVDTVVKPDEVALKDDLFHAAQVIRTAASGTDLDYLAQFVGGVARSAGDTRLATAAKALADRVEQGTQFAAQLSEINSLVEHRIQTAAAI